MGLLSLPLGVADRLQHEAQTQVEYDTSALVGVADSFEFAPVDADLPDGLVDAGLPDLCPDPSVVDLGASEAPSVIIWSDDRTRFEVPSEQSTDGMDGTLELGLSDYPWCDFIHMG